MPRRRKNSVFGPYHWGRRWIVEVRDADGGRRHRGFTDETEAQGYADRCRRRLASATGTLEEAIEGYGAFLTEKGTRERSRVETARRLRLFFGPYLSKSPYLLDVDRAHALYRRLVDGWIDGGRRRTLSVDTHRNMLAEAKSFLTWAQRRGWTSENALATVEGVGRRKRGKPQLRIEESRAWYAKAVELAAAGDHGAVAALMAMLLGIRASEIVERVVRDVDDEGRVLWIPDSKTEAGRRTLEVPPPLSGMLLALVQGRQREEKLFGRHWRDWPRKQVVRICELAGVPRVSAHGMRGTHSSIAREHGATGRIVADAMGHVSERMHEEAYAKRESVERARQRRAKRTLERKR